MGRGLDGVDVIVVRAEVGGIAREHRFQDRNDLFRPGLRRPVGLPEFPRPQVHQALGPERGRVEVVGILPREIPHRLRVIGRESRKVRLRIGRVAARDGARVGPLPLGRISGERHGLLRGVERLLLVLGVDVEVDVGPERERDPPQRHRRLRVERRGPLERADGLVVVEPVQEVEPLVEEPLRLGTRSRDRVMDVADAGKELLRRRGGADRSEDEEDGDRAAHHRFSFERPGASSSSFSGARQRESSHAWNSTSTSAGASPAAFAVTRKSPE